MANDPAATRQAPGPEVPPPLAPGAEVAPGYRALALLRRGADLDVYDAWSHDRRCRCVAKLLRPDRRGHRRARSRLLRDGRLLLALSHPHIVRAYELLARPEPVLILETLGGATLTDVIAASAGRLDLTDLLLLGYQLGSALAYLHQQGTLHLDLKPSNVIISGERAHLIDLSIARPPGPGRRGVGTDRYMAPEQARGAYLGPAADVWGLGLVLFEAATGRRPFPTSAPGDEPADLPQVSARAPSVRRFRRLPTRWTAAIDQCLHPDPAARPTLATLLALFAELAPSGAIRPTEADGPAADDWASG